MMNSHVKTLSWCWRYRYHLSSSSSSHLYHRHYRHRRCVTFWALATTSEDRKIPTADPFSSPKLTVAMPGLARTSSETSSNTFTSKRKAMTWTQLPHNAHSKSKSIQTAYKSHSETPKVLHRNKLKDAYLQMRCHNGHSLLRRQAQRR